MLATVYAGSGSLKMISGTVTNMQYTRAPLTVELIHPHKNVLFPADIA